MRFDSFKSLNQLLVALGNQGYQVPFLDYEELFKKQGFNKHIHCYNFSLSFKHYDDISFNTIYFVLETYDEINNHFAIMGVMSKDNIISKVQDLLLALAKYNIPHSVSSKIDDLLKVLGDAKYEKY